MRNRTTEITVTGCLSLLLPGALWLLTPRTYLASLIPWLVLLWLAALPFLSIWDATMSLYIWLAGALVIHWGSSLAALNLLLKGKYLKVSKARLLVYSSNLIIFLGLSFNFYHQLNPLTIYRIESTSMLPTLLPDDWVVVDTRLSEFRKNEVVIFNHPSIRGMQMVKRINNRNIQGVELLGDNPKTSVDSRVFGRIPYSLITGKARWLVRDGHILTIPDKPSQQKLSQAVSP